MRTFTELTSPDPGPLNYRLRPVWARHGVTVGCVALGWLGRAALTPTIGPTALPFIFFFPAVVIASWYGGLGAGVLATILSAGCAYWAFIPPIHAWSVIQRDEYHIMFFVIACGFIVCAMQEMHRRTAQALSELTARQQAERQNLLEAQAARRLLELGNHCSGWGDNFDRCLAEIVDAAIEVTNADKGNIQLVEKKTGALVLAAHRGFDRPFLEFFASVHDETAAVCSAAMRSVQRIIVEDVASSEIFANQPSLNVLLEAGVRAVQSTPLISSDGKIVGMISTHFSKPHQPGERELRFMDLLSRQAADYIERKQAEKTERRLRTKLQQQLDRLNTLLEIAPVGIWIGNSDCSDVRGNPSAYRIMGFEPGRNASVTTPNPEVPSVRIFTNGKEVSPEDAPMQQVARSGKPLENIEHEIIFPDGTRKVVYASIAPLFDENGHLREVIGAYADLSEWKQAEEKLRQSEERFRALVSIMTDITWRTDAAGDYVTPQHSWEKFTGQTFEQHRGNGWVNAVHPDDRERVAEIWRRACETRTPYESRGRLWHAPSQSWHYYVGRAVPLFNDDGSVREWVGCDADVHEQKLAEAALRESEQRFRSMANGAPVMIWLSGTDKLCTWFNQQWLEFTGRSMEQELGNGWAESVHKEDFDRCLKTYVESFDARQPFTMEYRLRRNDGEWRWVLDQGVPTYNGEEFTGYIGSCVDVTKRRQAETALKESEKRIRQLLALLPVGVYTINANGEITYYNDQAAVLWGRRPKLGDTEEHWCGSFRLWMPDGSPLPHDRTPMTQVLAEGRSFRNLHLVIERPPPDSSRLTVLVNIDPIVDDETGRVVGAINVFHDVTALRETVQMLREALQTRDRFLASVSHELRTPLTPVLMMTEMLQQNTTLPQSVKNALEVIGRNVQVEAKLVNDLLDISRAMSGKLHVELTECDLHEIVERALRVCFGPNNAKQVNVVTKLNATHRKFAGDATRLQQVFWNLIQNAVKFTSPGGSITISSRNENGRVCVDVSDTGHGIEPAMLERIFEPFTEENSVRNGNANRGGLGLGLSIARSIVAAHGGTLVAASDGANRGATFTVSLPISSASTILAGQWTKRHQKNRILYQKIR